MDELEELIQELLKKQDRIIPIIGDDCFEVESADNLDKRTVSLQVFIAETLLREDGCPDLIRQIGAGGYYGMGVLCDYYCSRHSPFKRTRFRKLVRSVVEKGVAEGRIHLKDEIKRFLAAGKFDVVVTTNAFHILDKEISYNRAPYHVKTFVPVAQKEESRSEEKLSIPSIYQVFGDCDGEFVLTEDDLLRFLHYLNFPGFERGQGANALVKYIKEKSISGDGRGNCILMPIGCDNLPNWLFRFLWYPLSPDLLLGKNDDFIGGIWHKYSSDQEFHRFLSEYNFQTPSNPLDPDNEHDPVLSAMTKQMEAKSMELGRTASIDMGVEWQEDDHWDVFISYASEDTDFVTGIYNVLSGQLHKKVWMDNRKIRLGDRYWNAIRHGIENSDRCMFVFTEDYLRKAIIRTKRNEHGIEEESGVFKEIQMIEHFYLQQRRDGNLVNSYAIPVIKRGTKVKIKVPETGADKLVPLDGSLLESLYKQEGYEMLRTDALLLNTQSVVFDDSDMQKQLFGI